jgi:hypothetical protein
MSYSRCWGKRRARFLAILRLETTVEPILPAPLDHLTNQCVSRDDTVQLPRLAIASQAHMLLVIW